MSVQIYVCSALGTIQHQGLQVSVYSRCQVTCPIVAKQKAKLTNQIHHTQWRFGIHSLHNYDWSVDIMLDEDVVAPCHRGPGHYIFPYTCSLYVLSRCSHARFRSLCNSNHQAVYTHFHTGVATVHYTVLTCVIGYFIQPLSECIQQKHEYKSHLHTHICMYVHM